MDSLPTEILWYIADLCTTYEHSMLLCTCTSIRSALLHYVQKSGTRLPNLEVVVTIHVQNNHSWTVSACAQVQISAYDDLLIAIYIAMPRHIHTFHHLQTADGRSLKDMSCYRAVCMMGKKYDCYYFNSLSQNYQHLCESAWNKLCFADDIYSAVEQLETLAIRTSRTRCSELVNISGNTHVVYAIASRAIHTLAWCPYNVRYVITPKGIETHWKN